jgi:hypothetical protein
VCDMEARDLVHVQLHMLFHAHLMHDRLLSRQVAGNVSTPGWMAVEARDAWMRQVGENSVSRLRLKTYRELAKTFAELGVRHEVEHVTDDGYFSIGIYMPDHDVGVEFDGPSHYYHDDSKWRRKSSHTSMTRTAKTELRNLFLAEWCAKVLTVPYFEFEKYKSPEKRAAYVRERLTDEGLV